MSDNTTHPLGALAHTFVEELTASGIMFASAESCTGGMIASAVTDIAGSSAVLDRAFVTYSNEAKHEMLGVDMAMIDKQGAVSEAVAAAMADGALMRSNADIAVAVTGIAGPGGGSDIKPVGLVWFACAATGASTLVTSHQFDNQGRDFIRYHAAMFALEMALQVARDIAPNLDKELPVETS